MSGDWTPERRFAEEFFARNPGASVTDCTKAMNNAHLRPVFQIVKEVRGRFERQRLEAMTVHPTKPPTAEGPRHFIPDTEPRSTKPETTPMAPNTKDVPTEKDALTQVARQLQAAMRLNHLATCTFIVDDTGPKTKVEWEVTRKTSESASIEL